MVDTGTDYSLGTSIYSTYDGVELLELEEELSESNLCEELPLYVMLPSPMDSKLAM